MSDNQLKRFAELLEEATEGVRPPERGEFFAHNFRTHHNVSYCAPQESDDKIRDVVLGFDKKFGDKYTLNEMRDDVREVFAARLQDSEHDMLSDLREITERYESLDTKQVLVRRISGVELSGCSIMLGRILLVTVGDHVTQTALEKTEEVFARGNLSGKERESRIGLVADAVSKEFEGASGDFQINTSVACVLRYTGVTPAKALEHSQEEIEFVLDLLRYYGVATQGRDVRVDFAEAYPSKNSVAFVTNGRVLSLQPTGTTDDYAIVRIGPAELEDLEGYGVFQLADYNSSDESHGLKKAIARGVHWLALASMQRDKANKIVLYITALESIFHRTGQAKVSDCCAFLLGVDAEGRAQIAGVIKDFYDLRNAFAHGGKADGVEGYRSMRRLVVHTIRTALNNTADHKTANELSQSFDALKFAFPSDTSADSDTPDPD